MKKYQSIFLGLVLMLSSNLYAHSQELFYNLDELVIKAKSLAQQRREAPTAITILDPMALSKSLTGLNEALDKAAGVKVSKRGGLGSQARVLVQGLDGKRIGIFINGMPMGHADDFDLSMIPIDMIKYVEVYKGIIPAKLGGDGLGGAINIILADYHQSHFGVSYETGSYNTHLANFQGKKIWSKQGIGLDLGGVFNYSDNNYQFLSPFQAGLTIRRDHDVFRHYGGNIGVDFSKLWFDNISIGLTFDNIYDEIQGGLMNLQNNIQHAHTKSSAYSMKQSLSKKLLDQRLSIDLNTIYTYRMVNLVDTSHYAYDFAGHKFPSSSGQGEVGSIPNDSRDKYHNLNMLFNMSYRINEANLINWNTFFQNTIKNPHDELADKYSKLPVSGYPNKVRSLVSGLTYELSFLDRKLINELGFKFFTYHSEVMPSPEKTYLQEKLKLVKQNSTNWGWSEAIAFHLNDDITFKGSVHSAIRIPNANEMFGDGVYLFPSFKLKPEKALNLNLGVSAIFNSMSYPNLRLDLNAFYMKIDDMIKLMYGNMTMVYDNIGKAEVKGIDLEANATFLPWLRLNANMSYQKALDMRKDAVGGGKNFHYKWRIPNTPYLFGNASLICEKDDLLFTDSSSSLHFDVEYTHSFSYGWEASDRNEMIVPTKVALNLGLQQSFGKHYRVGLEVRNLLNRENWAEFRYPLPKRTFHLKLNYTL